MIPVANGHDLIAFTDNTAKAFVPFALPGAFDSVKRKCGDELNVGTLKLKSQDLLGGENIKAASHTRIKNRAALVYHFRHGGHKSADNFSVLLILRVKGERSLVRAVPGKATAVFDI